MMHGLCRFTCFFIFLIWISAVVADLVPAPWLGFDQGVSPVARPLDVLMWAPNAATASPLAQVSFQTEDGRALWQVSPRSGNPSSGQWGTLGSDLPAGEMARGLEGVRLHLESSGTIVLGCEFHSGFNKTRGFFGSKVTGRIQKTLYKGSQTVDFLYSEAGISAEGRLGVGGARLVVGTLPVELKIDRLELLFSSAEAAARFATDQSRNSREGLSSMHQWLMTRGVTLPSPPAAVTDYASDSAALAAWEKLGWQAAWMIAMGEQITWWRELAESGKNLEAQGRLVARARELEGRRVALADKLQKGILLQSMQPELGELQRDVDVWIEDSRQAFPPDSRRWTIDRDRRFVAPSGKPYRMFGPFFFRAIYSPTSGMDKLWRPWDLRYLSALGFNGIRLPVQWDRIEPEQGRFDPVFLGIMKDIMTEAERYGLGVSIDLHWPYPAWFRKGKPGFEPDPKDIDTENSYHWPEALVDTWGRLAAEFSGIPNIVAFEVPTNETPIAKGPKGVLAYPTLVRSWNDWLKNNYGARAALAAAWETGDMRYSLAADENWDLASIRPLGFQGDVDAAAAYENNPRLWDHLRWTAWMQEDVSSRIMTAIRQRIPAAIGIMQRTIGDAWDRSPVPIDYNALQTLVGDHVWPGTHYGMGGPAAWKARVFSLGSFDSEQQMENGRAQVERHVKLGLGFCPFAFHARGGGGMLFRDDTWHLKKEVLFLPEISQWIRNYWPESNADRATASVAVIENTRLSATSRRGMIRNVFQHFSRLGGVRVDLLESLRVVRDPALLANYDAVVTEGDAMDARLLDFLESGYRGQVLLFGGLDRDAYARRGKYGTASSLARRGLLFSEKASVDGLRSIIGDGDQDAIDLTGFWDWHFAGEGTAAPVWNEAVRAGMKAWRPMQVPGLWGERELLGTREFMLGDAWYRKEIVINKLWQNRSLVLEMGAIDDVDWVFVNGHLIGHTGETTPEYWMTRRTYPMPREAIRWGEKNEIVVCVRNLRDDGGIWKGPVQIGSALRWRLRGLPGAGAGMEEASPAKDAILSDVSLLHGNSQVLAWFESDAGSKTPALVSHGRWHWWAADLALSSDGEIDDLVARWLLEKISPNTHPRPPARR